MRYTAGYFREKLNNFIVNNPGSNIVQVKNRMILQAPWEDETIAIHLSRKPTKGLIDTLNSLVLPPHFSAIFHIDTNLIEFIWGPIDKDNEILSRSFEYNFNGNNHKCYFAEATDRLKTLAEHVISRKYVSYSDHRNLLPLRQYYRDVVKTPEATEDSVVSSFFIEGLKSYDEPSLIEISKNLNFNMHYFDRRTPHILIHSLPLSSEIASTPIQYINDSFPNIIVSSSRDSLLLDLALAALDSHVRMKYLYYYQIIERAAYFYLSEITKTTLNKIIHSPDIQANVDFYIDRISETVLEDARSDDETKVEKVIKSLCNSHILWKEILVNMEFHSKPTKFDGGFTTNFILNKDCDYDYFCNCWHPALIHQLRHIRNALAHGREKKFGFVISPTIHNEQLLVPWTSLIARMAEEIILYSIVD